METIKLNIDIAQIKDTAFKGIRRTTIFLGLGINASSDERLVSYQLIDSVPIQLVPQNASAEALNHYKEEFGKWIVTCGIRELIEWFALFLDQIHHSCLLMMMHSKEILNEDFATWNRAYHYKGIGDKLTILKNRFGFDISEIKNVSTIQDVRNCLTHRAGVVNKQDINDEDNLTLKWLGFDVYIEEPDGNRISLNLPIDQEGVLIKNGGEVKLAFVERTKSFKMGEVLVLEPKLLIELCNYVLISTEKIVKQTTELAKAKKIPGSGFEKA
ncbi:hypothetical protein [Aurantivibrio infirmus]